jgi:hypothetical protein
MYYNIKSGGMQAFGNPPTKRAGERGRPAPLRDAARGAKRRRQAKLARRAGEVEREWMCFAAGLSTAYVLQGCGKAPLLLHNVGKE